MHIRQSLPVYPAARRPPGADISGCFTRCAGLLVVSHGILEVQTDSETTTLGEGESVKLPLRDKTALVAAASTDVLFFDRGLGNPKSGSCSK